jgi:hypothetical protein
MLNYTSNIKRIKGQKWEDRTVWVGVEKYRE